MSIHFQWNDILWELEECSIEIEQAIGGSLKVSGAVLIIPQPMAARTAPAAQVQVLPLNTGGFLTSDSRSGNPELSAIRTSLMATFSGAGWVCKRLRCTRGACRDQLSLIVEICDTS